LSSQGTINYPTQLHLVGYSRKLCHDARNHERQIPMKFQGAIYV